MVGIQNSFSNRYFGWSFLPWVHVQIQNLVLFDYVMSETVHHISLDVTKQRLLKLLNYALTASGWSVLKYLVKQVKRHNLWLLHDLGYIVKLINNNRLACLETSTNLQANFLQIEVYLISANALEYGHIRCHLFSLTYNFFIDFSGEHMHVYVLLLGIDFFVSEHWNIPLGGSCDFPNKYANFRPELQKFCMLLFIVVTDWILSCADLLFIIFTSTLCFSRG